MTPMAGIIAWVYASMKTSITLEARLSHSLGQKQTLGLMFFGLLSHRTPGSTAQGEYQIGEV